MDNIFTWKLISIALALILLLYSMTFRNRLDETTLIKCQHLYYNKYFDMYGNLKEQIIIINQTNISMNLTNLTVKK